MKISKDTIAILKHFATINSNLMFKKGSTLSVMNVQKNVVAEAEVADTFPIDFGVYDSNEFLGIVSLFTEPDITFKEKYALISDANSSVKFYAADASVLVIPTKKMSFPAADIEFELTAAQLQAVQKIASVLRATDVSVVGKNGKVEIVVGDLKNPTANSYTIDLGTTTDKTFSANLRVENLKLMPQDYTVSISSKKISRFVNTEGNTTVYIALESTSTFE